MQQAENFHGEMSRDKPRHRAMVKMVVRNRNTSNLTLFGNVAQIGESEIAVYVDDVEKVMALVEADSSLIAAAKKQYVNEIAEEVKGRVDGSLFKGNTADMVKLLAEPEKLPEDIAVVYKKVLDTTSKSMPATFERINGRGLLPLDSAEVIKGSEHPEYHRRVQLEEAAAVRLMQQGEAMPAAPVTPALSAADIAEMIKEGVREGVREELAKMAKASKAAKPEG